MSKVSLALPELVSELKKQQARKKDFIVPASLLSMQNGQLIVNEPETETTLFGLRSMLAEMGIEANPQRELVSYRPLDTLHEHIGEKLDIPRSYYKRMLDKSVALLDTNVNHWFVHPENKDINYLLRTFEFDNRQRVARSLLSDRYFTLDHLDILTSTLKAVKESGINIQIQDCDISDKKMYVRFGCPEVEEKAPELLRNYRVPGGGDSGNPGIISGFVISNSETGHGGFSISPRAVILACKNGMIRKEDSFKKVHLGAKLDAFSFMDWSRDTKRKNLELVQSQIVDCVKRFTSKKYLGQWVAILREEGQKDLKHPIEATRNVCKSLSLTETEIDEVLGYFIQGGITNAFGISQSLTHFAHETSDAELQYEMESAGMDILSNVSAYDYK